ncbi:MAG: N-formylglutamate amidohydrolase [Bdellovibrionales bacterium]|nr:N-formylglutamate amidohydrolase [Bdellovibrionales bacterium]
MCAHKNVAGRLLLLANHISLQNGRNFDKVGLADCLRFQGGSLKPPFFVSIPHSGEKIPNEVVWLQNLPEEIQMCDVDRFVDRLYGPALVSMKIPHVVAEWHRYFADLNRIPEDIDEDSVQGASTKSGTHTTGFIWVTTTKGDPLLKSPIDPELFRQIILKYWQPFHDQVRGQYEKFQSLGFKKIYQLDAHSMPSLGTEKHRDPGERRAEIVISDQNGKSCEGAYRELVIGAYKNAGFQVKENWPYVGGRVTQTYGQPSLGQHCIQVELNRALYMNEETKKINEKEASIIQIKIQKALAEIYEGIGSLI